jgi:hypothetical protein
VGWGGACGVWGVGCGVWGVGCSVGCGVCVGCGVEGGGGGGDVGQPRSLQQRALRPRRQQLVPAERRQLKSIDPTSCALLDRMQQFYPRKATLATRTPAMSTCPRPHSDGPPRPPSRKCLCPPPPCLRRPHQPLRRRGWRQQARGDVVLQVSDQRQLSSSPSRRARPDAPLSLRSDALAAYRPGDTAKWRKTGGAGGGGGASGQKRKLAAGDAGAFTGSGRTAGAAAGSP